MELFADPNEIRALQTRIGQGNAFGFDARDVADALGMDFNRTRTRVRAMDGPGFLHIPHFNSDFQDVIRVAEELTTPFTFGYTVDAHRRGQDVEVVLFISGEPHIGRHNSVAVAATLALLDWRLEVLLQRQMRLGI